MKEESFEEGLQKYKKEKELEITYFKLVPEITKSNARQLVCWAIKKGKLKRKNCEVCNKEKVFAHHEDYSKPLEVVWLCLKHHFERHKILNQNIDKIKIYEK